MYKQLNKEAQYLTKLVYNKSICIVLLWLLRGNRSNNLFIMQRHANDETTTTHKKRKTKKGSLARKNKGKTSIFVTMLKTCLHLFLHDKDKEVKSMNS